MGEKAINDHLIPAHLTGGETKTLSIVASYCQVNYISNLFSQSCLWNSFKSWSTWYIIFYITFTWKGGEREKDTDPLPPACTFEKVYLNTRIPVWQDVQSIKTQRGWKPPTFPGSSFWGCPHHMNAEHKCLRYLRGSVFLSQCCALYVLEWWPTRHLSSGLTAEAVGQAGQDSGLAVPHPYTFHKTYSFFCFHVPCKWYHPWGL